MNIKQIKWKPFISVMAVIFVVAQALMTPLSVLANSTNESTKMYKVGQTESGLVIQSSMNPTKNLKATGNSSGVMSATYGGYETKTAYIEVDGEPAFCIEPSKLYPVNVTYAQAVYNDPGVRNILKAGYPYNGSSEKNYVDTYVALNYYLGNFDSPAMANDLGVKELLDHARNLDMALGTFKIKDKNQEATWNASTKQQETPWYVTETDSTNAHFTLNLPSGVSVVTRDGNKQSGKVTLTANSDFKLVANASFDKTVALDVPTDIHEVTALKFTPNDSSAQQLLKAGNAKDPISIENLTAKFTAQTGDGIIVKKDKDSGKTLSGAQYHVTGDDFDKTVTTNSDGKVNLNDLIVGNYKVVETKAPAGYTIDSTPKTLTIKPKETTTLNVNNKEAYFQVKLTKEDTKTGAKPQGSATLQGAEYTFYADSALTKPLQTVIIGDNNTAMSQKFSFENKTERTIYFKETKAPTGYNIDTKTYTVKATQDNQTTEVFLETATSKDKVIEGKVAITKTAGMPEDGNYFGGELPVLEGAEFTITSNTTNQVVDTITTDGDGRAESNWLPYDTYTVHESITPASYQPVPDFQVTIDTEGKTHYYVLEDVAKSSAIKVVKKDATTGKVIPAKGTQFRILDAMGNVIEQKVTYPTPMTISLFETASDGSFTMPYPLIAGDYFLQEVKAPIGYALNAEPIPFTVTGDVNEVTVECENTPQMGKIVLDKFGETVDNDKTTTNKIVYKETLLPNTEYDVLAKNDIKTADGTTRAKKSEVVDHVKTDAKGHAETKELFLGDYTLHETKAPTGYTLGADKEVSLKYAGQEVKVTSTSVDLHNKLVKSDVVITKKGSDGKKLAGVEFSLYDSHGKLIMTGTTDKNGQLTFKNVPYLSTGYSVKETKGIDGYKMDTTAQKVSIEKDRESILLNFVNEKIPAKPLPKTGDKTNTGTLVGGGILVLGGLTGLFATAYLNRKKKA
ncbi:SpaA isopeptide-forming pilin-related protein [Listeria monocytogenes]|uniref:LPXTG cell wall anchor domain-containing protein n=1 Tax=Listeria monocytogenes TaxID=1639 RepID=A0A612SJ45_LISMN|nr:SpaA isopeptide-forming pilin-related protein [Listeria monocytogenes]EAC9094816.1 LPXTG cell wall anchor domain-containing protein [Listeria monocytogenes]EAF2233179.1 LPXTG cell wall anchor domain-containing protein [Listeria monocytogenes]EAG3577967.1 LPXTG cell wall anchor domain-containing protein [Listeria monocytogenes]EAG6968628.1 LPXTG cell wall anchor domain-containing protein [Listeria monocytogenes]EAG9232458.1 LPXTG cell wall anchor domain-containing protein [Listeria monocytog